MKYIKISNLGEIEPNAFKLIGASTKRDDDTKIGYFGSGLKYGMAFLLRENIGFKIFSGMTEVIVSTKKVKYRDQEFEIIQINGDDTSMTTEMGPEWNHWGAIREIYCNAIDEGGDDISVVDDFEIEAEAGITIFYIELTSALTKIIDKWDVYFSKERTDIVYRQSMGTMTGKIFWSDVDNEDFVVYRKGIQCFITKTQSCFHYDFQWIEINESREIASMYNFRGKLVSFFSTHASADVLRILLEKMDVGLAEYESDLDWSTMTAVNVETWTDACAGKTLIAREISGWYIDRLERERHKYWLLPGNMILRLQRCVPDILTLGEKIGEHRFYNVDKTEKQKFLLNEVSTFFKESEYNISSPIHVVKFEESYILGYANNDQIYVSVNVFELGRRKLAEVIYEENEHIKTNLHDETRGFQDHLVSQVISRMEEKHAFFL